MTRPLPLAGLRILAFEQSVAARLATRLLVDWGADVLKVERPDGGDFARHWDDAVSGWSSYVVWLNRRNRSVVVERAPARALPRLSGDARVGLADWGLDHEEIERLIARGAVRA